MLFCLFTVVFAGGVTAFTPPGFEPLSTKNLIVTFGSQPAINGAVIKKAGGYLALLIKTIRLNKNLVTASAPSIWTAEKLTGSYTIMMVDLDVPSGPGTKTSELLHWMQSDMVPAINTSQIGGQTVYELISSTPAVAAYLQPSPPQKNPVSHRYVQFLLDTTDATSKAAVAKFGGIRKPFDVSKVVSQAGGRKILAANWFNVTAGDANVKTEAGMEGCGCVPNATATATSPTSNTTTTPPSAKTTFPVLTSAAANSVQLSGFHLVAVFSVVAVFL